MRASKEDKISVIIPVYKVEQYLRRCLESILQSTYQNLEVICINDGSPDHCLEIMQEMAEKDSRIIVIDQENQGVAAARNKGLARATANYIAFIDSDDFIHPEYFRSMMKCMKAKQADVVICNACTFQEDGDVLIEEEGGATYHRLTARELFKSYYARHMVWARIYRREHLEGKWFIPGIRVSDDTLFNLDVISHIADPVIYETAVPLYYYLIRETSIVRTTTTDKMLGFPKWYLDNRVFGAKKLTGWEWILPLHAIKLVLSYRYMIMFEPNRRELTKEADRMLDELIKELDSCSTLDTREKMIHKTMFRAPVFYRLWRIKNDPTMLIWEKNQKERRQSVK